MKRCEVDKNKLSPMMLQYLNIKEQNEDAIIFFRLGDFYEMFFEDAEEVAHALELTLTGKNAGLDERVPMCGIPHHAAEVYIDKLIKRRDNIVARDDDLGVLAADVVCDFFGVLEVYRIRRHADGKGAYGLVALSSGNGTDE